MEDDGKTLAEIAAALEIFTFLALKEDLEGKIHLPPIYQILFLFERKEAGTPQFRIRQSKSKSTNLISGVILLDRFIVMVTIDLRI